MINIDTRLLNQLTPDELFLLCHIVNFMNENRMCFPSNKRLSTESKFSESKILRVKNELVLKKIISVQNRFRPDGSQTSNLYKIESEYIGVFITGKKMSDLNTPIFTDEGGGVFTDEGGTPSVMNTHEVLDNISINKNEVLDDEKQSFSTNEQNKFSENKLNPFTIVANVKSLKEKEKISAKKEKESQAEPKAVNKTYHAFTIYCQTFEAISGAAYPTDQNGHYIMTKKDAGSMVYLMRFIDQIDRSGNWEEALKIFINAAWNLKDKWLQANFTPAILYSQSSKIFTAYQTSSPAAKEKAYNDEVDRLLAERMKKYQTQ